MSDTTDDLDTQNDNAEDDTAKGKPATSGHSDANSQTHRNAEDESPS